MRIAISFPPLESKKGIPLLSQNRQFQWFNEPTYIYPMVPSYAASLLKSKGYEVLWDDGIAQKMSYKQWQERIIKEKPDIIAIETKTPVVEQHWKIIDELKNKLPNSKVTLMGDHITAFPEESLQKSKVDYAITGGDYDFMLLNLANHLSKGEDLEGGFWYKDCHPRQSHCNPRQSHCHPRQPHCHPRQQSGDPATTNTGPNDLSKHDLNTLPLIDRQLTHWEDYSINNGNFKYTPGSYMMSGRDCWWGKCTFCSWTTLFPGNKFRTMSAKKALDEVENLIKLGVKEIMEDSGSLPIGKWLDEFCRGMIDRGYNKKITMSCNMRINGIKKIETWKLMKEAGFRFILFGLESANQETLDKINKGLKIEEIEPGLKICKEAGLEPHITAMIGYPWESKADAQRTIDLAKNLFKKGYVDTLQATIVIPYPGTPLYTYCDENDLLTTHDYTHFDQREQVMKSNLTTEDVQEMVQGLYKSFITPKFILRKIGSIRSWDDIKFFWMAGKKVLGHLTDFSKKDKKCENCNKSD